MSGLDANTQLLVLIAAAAVLLALPWVLRKPLGKLLEGRRVRRAVRSLGVDCAHDLLVPDGLDSKAFVENLVLTREYLLVVTVKCIPGAIFGAEQMDQWAQVTRERSYKFANPLRELEDMVAAVRSQLPGLPVKGLVLFDRDSSFPKGQPSGVLHLRDIDTERPRGALEDVPDPLLEGWFKLCGRTR